MDAHRHKQGVPVRMALHDVEWHVAFIIFSNISVLPRFFLALSFILAERVLARDNVIIGAGEVGDDFLTFAIPDYIGLKF